MKMRVVLAFVLVAFIATLAGCGGSDPAGKQVEKFFGMIGERRFSGAFPECGSATEPKDGPALQSWTSKFSGLMGGKVKKTVYTDDAGNEVSASSATQATVYFKCYMGAVSRANMLVWKMECVKEKDAAGNDKWCILFAPSKTMKRGDALKFLEES